jgi:hypothetical protein
MAAGEPLSDDEKTEIKRLHGEGHTLRQIADALDRAPSTISRNAETLGLTFDRSQTEAATKAHAIDAAARRAEIVDRLYRRAEFNLSRLEADAYSYSDRIATGIVTEILDHVPANEERNLVTAISTALSTAAKLEAVNTESDVSEDRSMLGDLLAKLRGVNSGA